MVQECKADLPRSLSSAVEEVLIVDSGKYIWRENIEISTDRRKRVKRGGVWSVTYEVVCFR